MSDYLPTDPLLMLMAGGPLPQAAQRTGLVPAGDPAPALVEFASLLTGLDFSAGESPAALASGMAPPTTGPGGPTLLADRLVNGQDAWLNTAAGPAPGGKALPSGGSLLPPSATLMPGSGNMDEPLPPGSLPMPGLQPGAGSGVPATADELAPAWPAGQLATVGQSAMTGTRPGGEITSSNAATAAASQALAGTGAAAEAQVEARATAQVMATDAQSAATLADGGQRIASVVTAAELAASLRGQFGWRMQAGSPGHPETPAGTGSMVPGAPLAAVPAAFSIPAQDPGAVLPPLPVPQGTDGLESWSRNLGNHLLVLAGKGTTTAQLSLDPESLGPLKVTIELNEEQAQLRFSSPQTATREALEAALPRLRELFADQGLELVRAEVDSGDGEPAGRQSSQDPPGRQTGWSADAAAPALRAAADRLLAGLLPVAGPSRLLDVWA